MTGRPSPQTEYLHWAKTQKPVRYALGSSEVSHYHLDRLPISIADLELDGMSYVRYPPLRQAIADKHGVGAENVVAVDGTAMANMLAMAALIAPGDEVLFERPTYEPMRAAAAWLGADIKRFDRRAEDGFRLDPDAIARAVTPRTKLIVIANLHNPSSDFADEATLRAIGEIAARNGAHVLVDEVYLDAAFDAAPRTAALLGDRFVCTASLTKVYGLSGLRCGWVLADPALVERMWRLNDLFGVSQPHAAERLACIALAHLDEIVAGTPERLARNRALLNAFLARRDDLESMPSIRGITAFPRLRSGKTEELNRLLREDYDTSIVPGGWFEMPEHFRVGIGGPTDDVAEGLARLGSALDALA